MTSPDCIVESGEIKKLARLKLKEYGIALFKLCQKHSLNYPRVKYWFNGRESVGKISQKEVIDLCAALGINIRITVVVSEVEISDDIRYEQRKRLSIYKKRVRKNEEEDEQV